VVPLGWGGGAVPRIDEQLNRLCCVMKNTNFELFCLLVILGFQIRMFRTT
jgi:hypothetical protein